MRFNGVTLAVPESAFFASGWSLHRCADIDDSYWYVWDSLNNEFNSGTPVLDSRFLRPMCRVFGSETLHMAAYMQRDEILALLLIERLRLADWQVFCPGQACIGANLIASTLSPSRILQMMTDLIWKLPGLNWRISFPRQDSALAQLSPIDSALTDNELHSVTTSVDVSGEFNRFWASRHKDVRRTIRRTEKKLHDKGLAFELIKLSQPGEMDAAVTEHGRLESAGWKGRNGTAIHKENAQGDFYQDVLTRFAEKGEAVVYQLRIGDSIAASLLTISQNGIQVILKTAYDELLAHYGPGRHLDYLVLTKAFAQDDVRVIENYTSSNEVDRLWATHSRPVFDVEFVYSALILKTKNFLSFLRG